MITEQQKKTAEAIVNIFETRSLRGRNIRSEKMTQ
jgi:hypothetical protein